MVREEITSLTSSVLLAVLCTTFMQVSVISGSCRDVQRNSKYFSLRGQFLLISTLGNTLLCLVDFPLSHPWNEERLLYHYQVNLLQSLCKNNVSVNLKKSSADFPKTSSLTLEKYGDVHTWSRIKVRDGVRGNLCAVFSVRSSEWMCVSFKCLAGKNLLC